MRKKQNVIWKTSTLWEQVERLINQYLKKSYSEYGKMQTQRIEK